MSGRLIGADPLEVESLAKLNYGMEGIKMKASVYDAEGTIGEEGGKEPINKQLDFEFERTGKRERDSKDSEERGVGEATLVATGKCH